MTVLVPTGNRIVVKRREQEEKTKGGLFIPNQAQDKQCEGTVIAVGPGRPLNDGSLWRPRVDVGDRVIFGKYGGSEMEVDGEHLLIITEDEIYAIVKG